MDLLPWKNAHKLRDIIDVMDKTCVEIFENKKRALEEGDELVVEQMGRGKDIMSILSQFMRLRSDVDYSLFFDIVKANKEVSVSERLTEKEVLGQVSASDE